jgi:hypothetical protein
MWSLGAALPLRAQLTVTADAGFGAVEYEGFLGSGALTVTPGIRYDARTFSLAAQGGWVLYESGRSLVQGVAAGAWLTPPVGGLRGEISGFGGVAAYADAARSGYGLLRGRLHMTRRAAGLWAGAGVGRAYAGAFDIGTSELAVGAWWAGRGLTVTTAVTRGLGVDSASSTAAYVDATANARWTTGPFELEGQIGVRPWSELDDEGVFGELQARLALTRIVAAQLGAGRYPADPLRGAVAGRWISAGVRIGIWSGRSTVRAPDERLRDAVRLPYPLPADAPELRLREAPFGVRAITIHAPGAARVEIAADFTDWQAVPLSAGDNAEWRLDLALAPGVYRLNVRVDGGPWVVPRGATPQQDEFGTLVGLIIVR